jgi:hypothetical protein
LQVPRTVARFSRNASRVRTMSLMAGARPIGSHGDYPRKTFPVPAEVRSAAALGLAYRSRMDRAYQDRTEVGAERARQLAGKGPAVTLRDVHVMRNWFARHEQDVRGVPFDEQRPSNGWVSILLWGGLSAYPWVEKLWRDHGDR